jgi:hypothetical protein
VSFGTAVSENGLGKAVKHRDGEGGRVSRLVNLLEGDVVTDDLNARLSSEGLLAHSAIITDVGDDVKA